MDKKKRVDTVLDGGSPDRPPVSLWYHFGLQHGAGEQFARVATDFFEHYDFDFLKVMNDYFYPPPQDMEAIRGAAELEQLVRFTVADSIWKEQFKALEIINSRIGERAYFLDTVFDSWQSIQRNMAAENMEALMADCPDALTGALERVTDNLIDYCHKVFDIGAAGIFLSIPAGAEIIEREAFLKFVKPFARKLLEATASRGKMNTLHVHGRELYFEDVLDLPAPVFSWWDRGPNGPSLQWVKERIPGCVMGGIDQTIVARRTRAFLKAHTREGLALGGNERFLLANGCSIDTWVYPGAVEAIVETVKQAGC